MEIEGSGRKKSISSLAGRSFKMESDALKNRFEKGIVVCGRSEHCAGAGTDPG